MQGAIGLGPWYVLVRMPVKAEVLLGLCAASADSLGTATQPLVQVALADTIVYILSIHAVRGNHRAAAAMAPKSLVYASGVSRRLDGSLHRGPHLIRPAR